MSTFTATVACFTICGTFLQFVGYATIPTGFLFLISGTFPFCIACFFGVNHVDHICVVRIRSQETYRPGPLLVFEILQQLCRCRLLSLIKVRSVSRNNVLLSFGSLCRRRFCRVQDRPGGFGIHKSLLEFVVQSRIDRSSHLRLGLEC
jgi:hypothetical protein